MWLPKQIIFLSTLFFFPLNPLLPKHYAVEEFDATQTQDVTRIISSALLKGRVAIIDPHIHLAELDPAPGKEKKLLIHYTTGDGIEKKVVKDPHFALFLSNVRFIQKVLYGVVTKRICVLRK